MFNLFGNMRIRKCRPIGLYFKSILTEITDHIQQYLNKYFWHRPVDRPYYTGISQKLNRYPLDIYPRDFYSQTVAMH